MFAFKIIIIFLLASGQKSDAALNFINKLDLKLLDFLNPLLDKTLSTVLNQKLANENGTRNEFMEYLLKDSSNEDLGFQSPQEIIKKAGFGYKNYYVTSDDGYISQSIRLINPKADRTKLKQPPVMLVHGGILDQTVWIWSSVRQHHPEKWPRSVEEDGPITSWNRSLAFTLANNGYDVWLIGIRGCNKQSQGHRKYKTKVRNLLDNSLEVKLDRIKYWQFTIDDIVKFELPQIMDKVLKVTGARSVNMVSISVSAQTTLSFLASHADYAQKVNSYIVMGPPINNKGSNRMYTFSHNGPCVNTPDKIGTLVFTEMMTSQLTRTLLVLSQTLKSVRYSLGWAFTLLLTGPSPTYQTMFEPAVAGHILQPTGFKMFKQYCQNLNSGKLRHFDYGSKLSNLKMYKSMKPPEYNISNIHVKNWAIVSGNNDIIGTVPSVQQLINEAGPHKPEHIFAPNYNHLDLVAGFDNDIMINLPVLKYLDRFQL